jgi:hypothetical protein
MPFGIVSGEDHLLDSCPARLVRDNVEQRLSREATACSRLQFLELQSES